MIITAIKPLLVRRTKIGKSSQPQKHSLILLDPIETPFVAQQTSNSTVKPQFPQQLLKNPPFKTDFIWVVVGA
jgi:hypothetical protein